MHDLLTKYLHNLLCKSRVQSMVKTVYRKNRRYLGMYSKTQHKQHIQRTLTGVISCKIHCILHETVFELYNLTCSWNIGIQVRLLGRINEIVSSISKKVSNRYLQSPVSTGGTRLTLN